MQRRVSLHVLAMPKTRKEFIWTDDEVELLLSVANDYKTKKAAESIDWESVKSKYSDILDMFKAVLPGADEERNAFKDFPHKKEEITKQVLTSKLKAIRLKYRQAVDTGRKTGHGRVVLIFYELCEKVWGGSPATEQIKGGLESSNLAGDNDTELLNTQVGNVHVYDYDLEHTESIGKHQSVAQIQNKKIIKMEKGLVENHLHSLPFFRDDSF